MNRALPPDERLNVRTSLPFLAFHLIPLAAIWTGVPAGAVVLAVVSYVVRMFFITAGYHRYFAHRAYRLPRWAQAVMAFGGTTALQKGPLWWAAHHRDHHRWSDTERDVHSPTRGFWWSHVGWILCDKYSDTDEARIRDFAKYPELRWLNRNDWVGPVSLAVASFLIAGWAGLVIGFGASTIAVWHGTFLVNSMAHVVGRRRYVTSDTSRNSAVIAVLTLGEGWHNNHHHYQASARQGFRWWEWDPSFYALWLLERVGIVRDLKRPSERIVQSNLIEAGHFDVGMFRTGWQQAAARLAAMGDQAGDALAERRQALEDRIEAVRHDLDAHRRAQREAMAELAAVRRAARTGRPLGA
ncbi:acyl-CoA desaturase [Acidimicrobiia bacterium EGI L10123]|uniref:acyl-CoA desaturase n=1 Tax=Salinilacustrithrix flava TaxID=2957203 RepID=UPI003D7C1CF1|nr:acyl-CoA desaturase [Acidimicrobiia bacterium EGI L10123]